MSELNHEYKEFRRGDFVSVLHTRREENGEISDWMRPALWMGHDGLSHYVRYVDGSEMGLNNSSKVKWIGR